MTALIVAGVVLVALVIGLVLIHNKIVAVRNAADEAWAQISVQLKRRHDLIPPLVNSVKGYASHEASTLEAVVKARDAAVAANTPADAGTAEAALSGALGRIFALSEAYPDLKASENFQQLQNELVATEDRIAFSRQYYNDVTRQWNTTIQTIPYSLMAPAMGARKRDYFEIIDLDTSRMIESMSSEDSHKPPEVEF